MAQQITSVNEVARERPLLRATLTPLHATIDTAPSSSKDRTRDAETPLIRNGTCWHIADKRDNVAGTGEALPTELTQKDRTSQREDSHPRRALPPHLKKLLSRRRLGHKGLKTNGAQLRGHFAVRNLLIDKRSVLA
jgi:hypothetical protein